MLAILVAQLGLGLYGLINYDVLIEKGLEETLYAAKDQIELKKAWETLQYENSCCGINKAADWLPILGNNGNLPLTCCSKNWSADATTQCTIENATKIGCKGKLVQFAKEHLIIWIGLGFTVIILVQVYSL